MCRLVCDGMTAVLRAHAHSAYSTYKHNYVFSNARAQRCAQHGLPAPFRSAPFYGEVQHVNRAEQKDKRRRAMRSRVCQSKHGCKYVRCRMPSGGTAIANNAYAHVYVRYGCTYTHDFQGCRSILIGILQFNYDMCLCLCRYARIFM